MRLRGCKRLYLRLSKNEHGRTEFTGTNER